MSEEISKKTVSVGSDQAEAKRPSTGDVHGETNVFRNFLRSFRNAQQRTVRSNDENKSDIRNSDDNDPDVVKLSDKRAWFDEVDLIINCIGFSVGLGNLWRFPYLAFKNGGGAFLIPYIILTFTISFPVYYMELLIGQYSGLNPVSVWSFCPFFKGLGLAILLSTITIQVYYNVIMAYSLYYLAQVFRPVLPWSGCFDWWGADANCYAIKEGVTLCRKSTRVNIANCSNASASSDQFWKNYVLNLSSGLEDPETIKWDLALVLLATSILICILTIQRHHTKTPSKFKSIYFTALFPFLVLIIYFCYAITLQGATEGLATLFIPKWSSLLDVMVWSEAAESSIYSAGLGVGGLIILGSKNDFNYKTSRCAFISTLADLFAGVLSATVTFMITGFLANKFNVKFSETTLSGYGLVFVTFPDAMINMVVPHLWAFAFFSMLFTLAVDASVASTEALVLGSNVLLFPSRKKTKKCVFLVGTFLFLAGLSCVTNGGAFVVNLLDTYAGGHSLMGVVMFEAVAFGWGYGVKQISKDIEIMRGSPPHIYMKICWMLFAPLSLIVMSVSNVPKSRLKPLYNVTFPSYADALGWTIVAATLLPIPVWMALVLFRHRKNLSGAFKPDKVWENAVHLTIQRNKEINETANV